MTAHIKEKYFMVCLDLMIGRAFWHKFDEAFYGGLDTDNEFGAYQILDLRSARKELAKAKEKCPNKADDMFILKCEEVTK